MHGELAGGMTYHPYGTRGIMVDLFATDITSLWDEAQSEIYLCLGTTNFIKRDRYITEDA